MKRTRRQTTFGMCGMQRLLLLLLLLILGIACATHLPHFDDPLADPMDASQSPCDNFHEHACGKWQATHELRTLGAHDMRTKLRAHNKLLLVRHLEASSVEQQQEQQQQEEQQLALFYGSCMSSRQSLHVYLDAVQRLWPHWPLLNNASSFSWAEGSAALRRFGAQGLWRLLVQPNWQAGEQRIFYLLAPSFDLLGHDAQSEFMYERYFKYLLLELGLRVRRAAALAAQLLHFERQLRDLQPPESARKLVLHEPLTLQQLDAQLPQLQLRAYFQQLLGERYTAQLLLVADSEYLQRLQQLLLTLANDADATLIMSTWLLLQLPAHFELHLHEDESLADQREHCLQQLNQLLPRELAQLQLRLLHGGQPAAAATFLATAQRQLQQLFASLKQQFERLLNETPIFVQEPATQTLALQKLRAMRLLLPQLQPSAASLSPPNQLTSASYDANLLRLSQAQAAAQFQLALECLQLPCPVAAAGQGHALGPLDVNAYYRLKQNAIELPLGLLSERLLQLDDGSEGNASLQQARLLGSFGYMLSHEMLHGFDYDGINYDAAGHLDSGSWPPRPIIRFGVRAGCYLGSRYGNATLAINENIADGEGLRLAFETLKRQQQEQQQQPLANATMRSFFVAFAQTWCGHAAATPSSGVQQQHATHAERVNNVLGNIPEFAEVFGCKAGSAMHPPNKCRIW